MDEFKINYYMGDLSTIWPIVWVENVEFVDTIIFKSINEIFVLKNKPTSTQLLYCYEFTTFDV